MKRSRKIILSLVLSLAVLVAGLYLLRWPLFGGIIGRTMEGELSGILEGEVKIEGLSGSLFTSIRFQTLDVAASGERALIRTLFLKNVDIEYNLFRLIQGDLSALSVSSDQGALVLDLDRPGQAGEEPAEPLVLPERLPRVAIESFDLTLEMEGRRLLLQRARMQLGPSLANEAQQGLLSADRIDFHSSEEEETWDRLHCPLAYDRGKIRVGPLRIGEEENLLQCEATLPTDGEDLEIEAEARLLKGRMRMHAGPGRTEPKNLEADIEIEGIDLALAAVWIRKLTGESVPLSGMLDLRGTAAGRIDDLLSFDAMAEVNIRDGGYGEWTPARIDVNAAFTHEELRVTACEILAGQSRIHISEGLLPFPSGRPDLENASARIDMDLAEMSPWLQKAGMDRSAYEPLSKAKVRGEGTLEKGRLQLKETRFNLGDDFVAFQNLVLSLSEEGLLTEINGLSGRAGGRAFELREPARVSYAPGLLEVKGLDLAFEEGSAYLEATLSGDEVTGLKVRLEGINAGFTAPFLPLELESRPLDWQGLNIEAEAKGPLQSLSGNLRLELDRVQWGSFSLERAGASVKFTPKRLDIESFAAHIPDEGGSFFAAAGCDLEPGDPFAMPRSIDVSVEMKNAVLSSFAEILPYLEGTDGTASAALKSWGTLENPFFTLTVDSRLKKPEEISFIHPDGMEEGGLWDVHAVVVRNDEETVLLERLDLAGGESRVSATARLPLSIALKGEQTGLNFRTGEDMEAEIRLARMGLDLEDAVKGLITADLKLAGPLAFPRGSLDLKADQLVCARTGPHRVSLNGSLENGLFRIKHTILSGASGDPIQGEVSLDLEGPEPSTLVLPHPGTAFNLSMAASGFRLQPYAEILGLPGKGKSSFTLEGSGTLGDPAIDLEISLEDAGLTLPPIEDLPDSPPQVRPFRFEGKFHAASEHLEVRVALLETAEGSLSASGLLPIGVGYDRIFGKGFLDYSAPVSGAMDSSEIDLESLRGLLPGIRRLKGVITGHAELAGTLAAPEYRADLNLSQGSFRAESRLPSLEELAAELSADQHGLKILHLDGQMGAGPIHVEGDIGWTGLVPHTLDLKVQGQNALLYRGGGLRIRADLDLTLQGPLEQLSAAGSVLIRDSRFVRRIPLLPGKGPAVVENASARFQPFSLEDPVGRNMTFDLTIKTGPEKAIRIANNLARGDLKLDLALKGTGRSPYLVGTGIFDDMLILLPNFRFRVDTGRIIFPVDDPFTPRIECIARGRRQSVDVDLLVRGSLNDPEILLISSPPLDYDSVVVLVSTGQLPENLQRKGVSSQAITQVGTYLGEELYYEFFGSEATEEEGSIMDRIELNIGSEVGPEGTENILFEYLLEEPWSIQLEQDIYSYWNGGIVYRIRFR